MPGSRWCSPAATASAPCARVRRAAAGGRDRVVAQRQVAGRFPEAEADRRLEPLPVAVEPGPDEAGRLAAVAGLALLDTPGEERFDRIVRLARGRTATGRGPIPGSRGRSTP
jgi:hypothetical protein